MVPLRGRDGHYEAVWGAVTNSWHAHTPTQNGLSVVSSLRQFLRYFQHKIRLPTGANQVLTFFDYLRQRAFESVLAGAQEALEVLESQENRSGPKPQEPRLTTPALASQAGPTAKGPESKSSQENQPAEDDELLPHPRRRGRPDQKPKGS